MIRFAAEIDAIRVESYSSAFSPVMMQVYGSRIPSTGARLSHAV